MNGHGDSIAIILNFGGIREAVERQHLGRKKSAVLHFCVSLHCEANGDEAPMSARTRQVQAGMNA